MFRKMEPLPSHEERAREVLQANEVFEGLLHKTGQEGVAAPKVQTGWWINLFFGS